MSLKDELDKLVATERQKLKGLDAALDQYRSETKSQFQVLRNLLTELASSVEAEHAEFTIRDDQASIEIGRLEPGRKYREKKQSLDIRCNTEFDMEHGALKCEEGFKIDQIN